MKATIALLTIQAFFSLNILAQTSTIKGFVYDESDGEPILFATVVIKNSTTGTSTDINGFFSIPKLEAGNYTVVASYIGYEAFEKEVSLEEGGIANIRFLLKESVVNIDDVIINAERQERTTQAKVSTTTITPKNIKALPSVGGEPDLVQYLQVLPGVVSTGDQGGQVYIRGGTPIQTKFLLDGMNIYNPFHSIGLYSVFETELLKNVDIYTGGFGAQYGDRISAVVDVTTRDGNKKRYAGKVSANPFVGKAIFEGPVVKLKESGGASASFLTSARVSYLDQTSPQVYSYLDEDLPYSFQDYFGKFSVTSGTGSKVSLFGFSFQDRANFQGVSEFAWNSFGFGGDFVVVPQGSNLYMNTQFNYSRYAVDLTEFEGKPRRSEVGGFNVSMDFTYFMPDGQLKYGFDVNGARTEFEFINVFDLRIDQNQNLTDLGAFFFMNKHSDKFVFEPGMRFQFYGSLGAISPEPRFSMKFNATDKLRFKAASGIYAQNLISSKSDRDVVNLFSGFLSGPEESILGVDGEDTKSALQRSFHLIFGVEYDVNNDLSINVEPYFKRFFQLIGLNRNKLFPGDPNYMAETGNAYGIDFLVKYETDDFFGWFTYSLGYVDRFDGEQEYNPHFDRRHNVNLLGSYVLGDKDQWEFSARWNLGSGFPFTQTAGFYESIDLLGGIDVDYTNLNGGSVPGIIYENELNGGRLPWYHRLDVSAKRLFYLSKHSKLELSASVSNLYNRENIFYVDRVTAERVNQLPILSSMGMSITF